MKHVIIGAGNLGLDLQIALGGDTAVIEPHVWPEEILSTGDVIWAAFGCGGPSNDPATHLDQVTAHVVNPLKLCATGKRVVLFSSHYLNNDPGGNFSYYARTKALMEQAAKLYPNVHVCRVGSLYGAHRLDTTLPGKLVAALTAGKREFIAARNSIAPTPTAWLAEMLVKKAVWNNVASQGQVPLSCFGPQRGMSVKSWMKMILDDVASLKPGMFGRIIGEVWDIQYPRDSGSYAGFYGDARALWREYGRAVLNRALGL